MSAHASVLCFPCPSRACRALSSPARCDIAQPLFEDPRGRSPRRAGYGALFYGRGRSSFQELAHSAANVPRVACAHAHPLLCMASLRAPKGTRLLATHAALRFARASLPRPPASSACVFMRPPLMLQPAQDALAALARTVTWCCRLSPRAQRLGRPALSRAALGALLDVSPVPSHGPAPLLRRTVARRRLAPAFCLRVWRGRCQPWPPGKPCAAGRILWQPSSESLMPAMMQSAHASDRAGQPQ